MFDNLEERPFGKKSFRNNNHFKYDPPGWQVCPICNGEGDIPNNDMATTGAPIRKECPTCRGKRIISKLNGKPPTYDESE